MHEIFITKPYFYTVQVKITSIIIQDEAVNEGDEKPQVAADIQYGERGGTEMTGFRTIV